MNNIKKDWKLYLISFLAIVFLTGLPKLILIIFNFSFSIDFMYLVFYYLIVFVVFLVSLVFFFFGWKKEKSNGKKTFLVYYFLLFLIAFLFAINWVGDVFVGILKSPMSFPG